MKTNIHCLKRPNPQGGTLSSASLICPGKRDAVKSVRIGLMAAIAMTLLLAPSAARAETSLTVGNARGYPGTTAAVAVYLAPGSNIVVSQFDVSFNTGKVGPAGAAMAPRGAGQRVKSREVAPGVRRVLAYSVNPALPRATNAVRAVATLPFALAAGEYVGSGPLTPANGILVQRDGTALTGVTLNSGAIFAQPVFLQADGTASFFLPSQPGTNYWVQASTDLLQWMNLSTNRATSDFLEASDSNGRDFDYRFYRAVPQP